METEIRQVRYNPMKITSLMAFANLKGGWSQGQKQVYFLRCIGYDGSYLEDIARMDRMLARNGPGGQGGYVRIGTLGHLACQEDIAFYTQAHRAWEEQGGRGLSLKSMSPGSPLGTAASDALTRVTGMFKSSTPHGNGSIERNFIIKLFYWADQVIPLVCGNWKWEGDYKLAISGPLKKQEYLFCYFLTLLGIHVLVLSPEKELAVEGALLDLSDRIELEKKGRIDIPEYYGNKASGSPATSGTQVVAGTPAAPGSPAHPCTAKVVIPPRKPREKNRMQLQVMGAAGERREKTFEELALLASSIVMISIHGSRNEVIGSGSGIMVGPGGYILTNNHVASGGSSYSVRIEDDDKVYETGEVIKYHSVLDLALIRIDRRLAPLPIYRGEQKLVRGQRVVAIGSPLGFFNSVSDGIISGFRRIKDVDMIQFTAPISHGSSGGALLNMFGEVIGISTAGIDNGQNINLAVDYLDIYTFVRGFL